MRYLIKIIVYAVILASLFTGLSLAKWRYGHHASLPQASHRALIQMGGADILLMGSSLARMGYDPRIIEQGTGTSAYVVAYNGMGPTYLYAVLKYLLEAEGLRPQLLIVEGSVLTASIAPGIRDKNLFFNAPPELKENLLNLMRENPGGMTLSSWYDLVIAAKNQDIIFHPVTSPLLSGVFYHGAHMHAPESSLTVEQFADVEPYPTDLEPFNERQMQAFSDIFSLVRRHGIRTAFIGPAIPQPLYDIPVIREKQDDLESLFTSNGMDYIDGTRGFPNDDPANYFDGRHFSARGRKLFSEFLVKNLRRQVLLSAGSTAGE